MIANFKWITLVFIGNFIDLIVIKSQNNSFLSNEAIFVCINIEEVDIESYIKKLKEKQKEAIKTTCKYRSCWNEKYLLGWLFLIWFRQNEKKKLSLRLKTYLLYHVDWHVHLWKWK